MHRSLLLIAASAALYMTPAYAQFSGFLDTIRQIRSTINEVNSGVREAKGALRDTSSTVKETTSTFTDLCSTLGVSCDESGSQNASRSRSQQSANSSELNRIYATWYQSLSQDEKEAAQFIVLEAAQGSKTDFKKFSTSSWFTSKPAAQQSRYASIYYKASDVISSAEKGGSKEKFFGYAFCIHSGSQTCQ
jgi:hypothetical protein